MDEQGSRALGREFGFQSNVHLAVPARTTKPQAARARGDLLANALELLRQIAWDDAADPKERQAARRLLAAYYADE